jgi:DNA topoisomerase-1
MSPALNTLPKILAHIDAQQINTMKLADDIEIRVGRFGAYIQQGEGDNRKFANIPENIAPDELTLQTRGRTSCQTIRRATPNR